MSALETLGGETWFKLGDKDLAMNIERTRRLKNGSTLGQATTELASAFGVKHEIMPMSNDAVRTIVLTDNGPMKFQDYFVRDRCKPGVRGFEYKGAANARLNPVIQDWLSSTRLTGIILCPSNTRTSASTRSCLCRVCVRLCEIQACQLLRYHLLSAATA